MPEIGLATTNRNTTSYIKLTLVSFLPLRSRLSLSCGGYKGTPLGGADMFLICRNPIPTKMYSFISDWSSIIQGLFR